MTFHRIGYLNRFDDATLTASSEVAAMPVQNLQDRQLANPWRTAIGETSPYVVADLGAAYAVGAVMAMATNLTSAATWRIRGATSEANLTAAPGYDSGAGVQAWPADTAVTIRGNVNPLHVLATQQTYRWWRVDFADAANPDARIEAGRMFLGPLVEPARNFQRPRSIGYADPSGKFTTEGSSLFINAKPGALVGVYNWMLTQAEMLDWGMDLDKVAGASGDILYIPRPDQTDYYHLEVIWGPRTDLVPFEQGDSVFARKRCAFAERDPDARAGS